MDFKNQLEWLNHIEQVTGHDIFVVDKTLDFNTPRRVRIEESECLMDPTKPVIGRFRIPGELVWDFECGLHKTVSDRAKIEESWKEVAIPPTEKLIKFLQKHHIPFVGGDSGRGNHIHIVTKGLIELAMKETGISELSKEGNILEDIKTYEIVLWDILSEKARVVLPEKISDLSVMKRTGQTVVRAFGGFNSISMSYKSKLIGPDKKLFPRLYEVVYPNEFKLWEVPSEILDEVKRRVDRLNPISVDEAPQIQTQEVDHCPYLEFSADNFIRGSGNRNNHLVKNLMILINRLKIDEEEKLTLIKKIASTQKTNVSEYMGWYKKAKNDELNDHFNCGEMINFIKGCQDNGEQIPLLCKECNEREFKDVVKVDKIESLNLETHKDKTIMCRATPIRMLGSCRAIAFHYCCNKCGETVVKRSKLAKTSLNHDCENGAKFEFTKRDDQVGFKCWMVNETTAITSSESLLCWIPFSSVGIDSKDFGHQERIYEFFKFVGSEIELTGKLRSIEKVNKTRGTIDVDKELIVEFAKPSDPLGNYEFNKKTFSMLRDKFGNVDWTDSNFVDSIIVPRIKGRALLKKLVFITLLTPLKLKEKEGDDEWGVGRGAVFGDGGSAKSQLIKSLIASFMKKLNAFHISAESVSTVGFSGAVVKEEESWVIKWGYATFAHNGFLCLDGLHMWPKDKIASLRELESQNKAKIDKAAKGERDCAFRGIKIANCRFQVRDKYFNKYRASFDIGNGPSDEPNKFSGPDRRRVDWMYVVDQNEVDTQMIDRANLNYIIKDSPSECKTEDEYSEAMKEIIKFAWTRQASDIVWVDHDNLIENVIKLRDTWVQRFRGLELRPINNEGQMVLMKYAVASAIMHARFDENGKILVTLEDVKFVYNLFSEMMTYLEMGEELKRMSNNSEIAVEIAEKIPKDLSKAIIDLYKYGGKEALIDNGMATSKTVYDAFGISIPLFHGGNNYHYCPREKLVSGGFVIEPMYQKNELTEFGVKVALIIQKIWDRKMISEPVDMLKPKTDSQILSEMSNSPNIQFKEQELVDGYGEGRVDSLKKKGLIIEMKPGIIILGGAKNV